MPNPWEMPGYDAQRVYTSLHEQTQQAQACSRAVFTAAWQV